MADISPIYDDPLHYQEIRAEIGGMTHIVISGEITGGIASGAAVGGTESRQLDLDIIPSGTIRESDPVIISVRLVSSDGVTKSDWIPKGTFYIDSDPIDAETGVMSIHAFDAMIKTEQDFLSESDSADAWPKSPDEVMARIAAAIGVTLDPRNNLNPAFTIPYPTENSTRINQESDADSPRWVLNTKTKLIHYPSCARVGQIDAANYQESDLSVADLEASGYTPCNICNPSDDAASADESASLSMRVVAGYIAAMHGGNWMITDQNQLYLVPIENFHASVDLLSADSGHAILFGNTCILV